MKKDEEYLNRTRGSCLRSVNRWKGPQLEEAEGYTGRV